MKIRTRKDLETFRDLFNNGRGCSHVVLENDIDLGGEAWTPIGCIEDTCFSYGGTFDGNGHTISGLHITDGNKRRLGIFASLHGACVKNLTVRGDITVNVYAFAGGIAGDMFDSKIINCTNHVRCETRWFAGGFCGICTCGEIKDCVNYADIVSYNSAGIVGSSGEKKLDGELIIKNCRNEGNLFILSTPCFCSDLGPEASVKNNGKYNQICDCIDPDISNKQKGHVFFEDNNSLFGMYMKCYNFRSDNAMPGHVFAQLLESDLHPEHTNKNGETYLHLLCQNHNLYQEPDKLKELILMLAVKTEIDFAAKNKDGKEATYFLKKTNGRTKKQYVEIAKLIEGIKNEKDRLKHGQEEETFSDIGF